MLSAEWLMKEAAVPASNFTLCLAGGRRSPISRKSWVRKTDIIYPITEFYISSPSETNVTWMTAGPIFHAYFGFEPQKQTNLCLLISGWQRVKWTNFYSFVMLQFCNSRISSLLVKDKSANFLGMLPPVNYLWGARAQRCKWAHPIHKVELIKFVAKNPPCSSKGTEINVRGGWIGSGCIFHVSMMRLPNPYHMDRLKLTAGILRPDFQSKKNISNLQFFVLNSEKYGCSRSDFKECKRS